MDSVKLKELSLFAARARYHIVEAVYSAKSGHPGGSLSLADILTYLYNQEMNINPAEPRWQDRDRFVLSKGHATPVLYSVLALRGFFPVEELKKFRSIDSYLEGHPDMKGVPGVDMSTGSLGQGISAACGMAVSAKLFNNDYRVYAALGDGEIEEGEVWEAMMFGAHYKLDNLCAVLDLNGLQIDGEIAKVMSPYPVKEKFEAFGWHVITIDGHDFEQIQNAYDEAKTVKGKPTMIIANTVKGKGVSFMENNYAWHGAAPNDEQFAQASAELLSKISELGGTL